MNIKTKRYKEQLTEWPETGHHIMAQYDDDKIIVYQSYRPEIGEFAVKHQRFGGPFSLERMTWIKPNFLWMMYRNGWGTKEGQEVTLAVHLKRSAFENYVKKAEYSSFEMSLLTDHDDWKTKVTETSARLQWDPDHDPYGTKLDRRAIQIGIRNELTAEYAENDIIEIEDISGFVKQQRAHVEERRLDLLVTPEEHRLTFQDSELNSKLKLS